LVDILVQNDQEEDWKVISDGEDDIQMVSILEQKIKEI